MRRLILLLLTIVSINSFGQRYSGETKGGKHFQQASTIISGVGGGQDRSGWAVDSDDQTLVVGATYDDYNKDGKSVRSTGSANIYVKNEDGEWDFQQILYPFVHINAVSDFGFTVKLHGDYLFIGARKTYDKSDAPIYRYRGGVFVYKKDINNVWQEHQFIRASSTNESRNFGHRVSASGNIMVTGDDQNTFIYNLNEASGLWEEKQIIGLAVTPKWNTVTYNILSVSEEDLIVDSNEADSIYIFQPDDSNTWVQKQKISKEGKTKTKVDLDGNQMIIGGFNYYDENDLGGAAIYQKNQSGVWEVKAELELPEDKKSSYYGNFVQIKGDYALVSSSVDYTNLFPLLNGYKKACPDVLIYRKVDGEWQYHQALVYETKSTVGPRHNNVKLTENAIYIGSEYQSKVYEFKAKDIDEWVYKSPHCEIIEWKDQQISEAGHYMDTSTIDGEEYIEELIVLDLPTVITKKSVMTLEASYDFNGKVLTESGVYLDTLQNQYGCDSLSQLTIMFVKDIEAGANCESPTAVEEGTYLMKQEDGIGWFSFTAPRNGYLTVSTCGLTEEDTEIYLYSSCGNQIAYSDDADCADNLESEATVYVDKGQSVLIKMDDYDDEEIDYPFNVSFERVCPTATLAQIGTENYVDASGGVHWFEYKADSNVVVNIATCGLESISDTKLSVYNNTCEDSLFAENDNHCDLQSSLYFKTQKGVSYFIKAEDLSENSDKQYQFEVSYTGFKFQEKANWANGLPAETDSVFIDRNEKVSGFSCKSLMINKGDTLTIKDGVLDIKGNIHHKGVIKIASEASLLTYAQYQTGNHNFIIERHFKENQVNLIGAPVTGSIFNTQVFQYDETLPYADGGRWIDILDTELSVGRGYSHAGNYQTIFKGKPNNGTIVYSGTYTHRGTKVTDGWNLVANPYTSAIRIKSFLEANTNLDGTVYLFNPHGSNDEITDYIAVNALGTVANSVKRKAYSYESDLGIAEGFFIKISNSESTKDITFTEDMRKSSAMAENRLSAISTNKQTLTLTLENATNSLYAETLLGFVEDATEGVDRIYDALKFSDSNLQLYSVIAGENYAIQGLPIMDKVWEIPLGMDVAEAGNYTISIKDLKNIADDMVIQLVDTNDNTIHNLSETAYNFTAESSVNSHRFYLKVGKHEVINSLDIETTTFEVKLNGIYLPNIQKHHIQVLDLAGKVLLDKMGSGFEGVNFKKNQLYIIKVDEAVKKISFR